MEYILNKSTTRTSNNYGINDIKLDLEIPIIKSFQNVTIRCEDTSKVNIKTSGEIKDSFETRIGLRTNQNYRIDMVIPKNTFIKEPIYVKCDFDEDNKNLVDAVNITFEENSRASILIEYASENDGNYFHNLKQIVNMEENSEATIFILNKINETSDSFISIENTLKENSKLTHFLLEIGGKDKISNYYSKLIGDNSKNFVKNIYIGNNRDIVDINYNIEAIGKKTLCNIQSEGAIGGFAKKNFKGIIDFKEGSTKSSGIENENCLILSDKATSRSLPILLCHEEDVYGEHAVSSGKPDKNKLFYMMARGISYEKARELMVRANFRKIVNSIGNENIREKIEESIDEKMQKNWAKFEEIILLISWF